MVAVVRLVEGGVYDKFPNLKVVASQRGGGIGSIWARQWTTCGRTGEEKERREKAKEDFKNLNQESRWPSRSISPLLILVEDIGKPSSAKTASRTTTSRGFNPFLNRISFISTNLIQVS